jgi:hypothetical protein
MILPLASIEATGSSRPILITTAPSSKPIATLRRAKSSNPILDICILSIVL